MTSFIQPVFHSLTHSSTHFLTNSIQSRWTFVVPDTGDTEVMQAQAQLSGCSQSNGEDRLINKMHHHRHMDPMREWSFLSRKIRNLSTKEETLGLGLKGGVGICQLVKAGEGVSGRGDCRQRGRSVADLRNRSCWEWFIHRVQR